MKKKCRRAFKNFVSLSNNLNLPLVVHSRNSMKDTLKILKNSDRKVIIHCFSGNVDNVEVALDRNYYLSFGGIIFRMEKKFNKIISRIPLENILLETDAPFLAKRKKNRSEPWFIEEVARKIAEIKDVKFSKIWKKTGKNAKEAFNFPIRL